MLRHLTFILIIGSLPICAQSPQQIVTPGQVNYFRYLLMHIDNPASTSASNIAFDSMLTKEFQLTDDERAVIHNAANNYLALIGILRSQENTIIGGKQTLSNTDKVALSQLVTKFDQTLNTITNNILNSIRPITASRLLAAGSVVDNAVKRVGGKW